MSIEYKTHKHCYQNFRLLGSHRILKEPSNNTIGLDSRDINRHIYRSLDDKDRLELRLTRQLVCELLGVRSFYQIREMFSNDEQKKNVNKDFLIRYGAMYGLNDKPIEIIEIMVQKALQEADLCINTFQNQETGLLRQLRTSIGVVNEISAIKNPIDLLLIMFSSKASRELRYEARRKLVLMDLSFRSNLETENHDMQIDNLIRFLNTNMWEGGLGVTDNTEVISEHSPFDYSVKNVRVLREGEKVIPSAYKRYTAFSMRRYKDQNGNQKHVYFEHRLKDPINRILKMMRKDTKNPATIDDYLGLKFVFETKKDIYNFLLTLREKFNDSDIMISYEEIYDTIANGDDFRITNPGSSEKLEIVKVHVIINGSPIEFQMHTFRTFLDSRYHDERGFEIFAIKRLFEGEKRKGKISRGIIDLLYPSDIYGPEVFNNKDNLLDERRMAVRNASLLIPKERTEKGYVFEKYSSENFLVDMIKIIHQLEERPEQIIAVGASGYFMAAQLSKLLGGVSIVEYNENLRGIDRNKRSLIVNGLTKDARRIKKLKDILPYSKVAVIAERLPKETNKLIDYRARTIEPNVWFHYFWEMADIKVSFAQGIALFYRINREGQIEFLVEESTNGGGKKNLKLIGGKHEKREHDLLTTVIRELNEETGKIFKRSYFKSLNSLSFNFIPDLDKDTAQLDIKKGFAQAFAKRVGKKFTLPITDKNNTKGYLWITADEFKKRSMWQSYISCIDRWINQIQEIENI